LRKAQRARRELAVHAEPAKPQPELTPEQWHKIKDLLATVIQLPPQERPAYLDKACAGDAALRAELESLIAAHEVAQEGHFERPLSTSLGDRSDSDLGQSSKFVGKDFGAYRIEAEIGRGGMGKVYRARRADDRFSKKVAIKLLDGTALSQRSLRLFRHEREILANLDHPNIARLLDAGENEDGVPYFVMEYVDGQPIDVYCDTHRLTVEQRLLLFLKVCSAVHYAHQNLVIHRDIKPANILVTENGEPKLLDFGIAMIDDANANTRTLTAWRMLTPAYASPEQILGRPLNIATDVYSLGLVLYELLTGRYAYGERQSALELQRAILEEDPQRPSAVIFRRPTETNECPTAEKISDARRLTPQKLRCALLGDLESIVLKAVRKEPTERYVSVERFMEDIESYLHALPVRARQGTMTYRFRKFVLRNRTVVIAGGLIGVLLIAGIVLIWREARIARMQQARAERRFNDVRKLANSLMFEVHDSIRDLAGATSARKLVIQRAQEYLDGLAQESKADPILLRESAAAYARLASVQGNLRDANVGDTSGAVQNYRKAAELLEADVILEPVNWQARLELAQAYLNLGVGLGRAGDQDGLKQTTQKALGILELLPASNSYDERTQALLGEAYSQAGFISPEDVSKALKYHGKALGIYEKLATLDPKNESYQTQLSFCHKRVGANLIVDNQLQAALEHERAALEIDEALMARHPDSVRTRYNITFTYSDTGYILGRQGHFDAAINYYRKALQIRAALAAADSQDTKAKAGLARTQTYIADLLRQKGDFAGAIDLYKQGLVLREALSEKDPENEPLRFEIAESKSGLGDVYAEMALRAGVGSAKKIKYCRESETWNRRALPMWLQMKSEGKLDPVGIQYFAKIVQNIENCSSITARPATHH
jgi:non-specific serine/threonine protein kinase/serine/threonine-protein kinase